MTGSVQGVRETAPKVLLWLWSVCVYVFPGHASLLLKLFAKRVDCFCHIIKLLSSAASCSSCAAPAGEHGDGAIALLHCLHVSSVCSTCMENDASKAALVSLGNDMEQAGGPYLKNEVFVRVLGNVHKVQHHIVDTAIFYQDLAGQRRCRIHTTERLATVRGPSSRKPFLGLHARKLSVVTLGKTVLPTVRYLKMGTPPECLWVD